MGLELKNYIPSAILREISAIYFYPRVIFLRRALRLYYLKLIKSREKIDLKGTYPTMPNFKEYEEMFVNSYDNYCRIVTPFISEFNWFIGRLYNFWFQTVDAELYYSIIRYYRPRTIVEIGSGYSTFFAMDAVKANEDYGKVICIDPEPRRDLPENCEKIKAKVEDIDTDIFRNLKENDILFIDSSHTTEEAMYHTREILPILQKGVICHHHDFFFPFSIYFRNDKTLFKEPDLLLDFYRNNRNSFEVISSNSYIAYLDRSLLEELIKSYRYPTTIVPNSLWARKIC